MVVNDSSCEYLVVIISDISYIHGPLYNYIWLLATLFLPFPRPLTFLSLLRRLILQMSRPRAPSTCLFARVRARVCPPLTRDNKNDKKNV